MELISRGAEADIYRGKWSGIDAIYKIRISKPYMIPELDERLRKERTIREAKMIVAAREAVPTPHIFYVGKAMIIMEDVGKIRLKEELNSNPARARILGECLGKLHSIGIMHGDPNTSNVIFNKANGEWYIIDFGLSVRTKRFEDFATDVHLVNEVFIVQHQDVYEDAFKSFLDGYSSVAGDTKRIVEKVKEIERRGRYARKRSFLF